MVGGRFNLENLEILLKVEATIRFRLGSPQFFSHSPCGESLGQVPHV